MIVQLRDVCKFFGELQVLKNITLTVTRGEVIVIVGPSGSGKSTLLRVINGLEPIHSGQVIVDGVDIHGPATDIHRIRSEVGMVFQSFNLFPHLNAINNVNLGLRLVKKIPKLQAEETAFQYLQKVGLKGKEYHYPGQLSGGQQQRVAIARALAMEPKVILFDEPTSALDPELVGEVLETMISLAREGRTMLVVSHEMGFAREVGQRLLFVDHGTIIEEGVPAEVMKNPIHERAKTFFSKIL